MTKWDECTTGLEQPAVAIEGRQADIPAQVVIAQEQRWCAPDSAASQPAPAVQQGSRGLRQTVDDCRPRAAGCEEKQFIEIRHDLSPSGVAECKGPLLISGG